MAVFDEFDLEPLPALASGRTDRAMVDANLFHDDTHERLIDAQTDSEVARAFLYHAELGHGSI